MCSRRHGEVVLEVRRLQKTGISSISKRNIRTTAQRVANQFLAASGEADLPKNCCQTTDIDKQYSGVGRHHKQWPHAPTCGCEWDYDEANDTLMKFYFLMFVFSVVLSVINLVYERQSATCHRTTRCSGLSRQRGVFNVSYGQRVLRSNPIENVWEALGGKLPVETVLRQTRTPSSVHSQRNGINCLNSCWIMLCKVWYDVWNVASHSTVDISRTDTFL
ncbi:hypothetical protein TNCV_5038191 [Trichonephila clavipes]|nr:hypothetical protein TNCV_5038191 [Trichonephila clavipes]